MKKSIRKIQAFYESNKFLCGVIAGEALMFGSIYYHIRKSNPDQYWVKLNASSFDAIANGEAVLSQIGSNLVWIAKEVHLPE